MQTYNNVWVITVASAAHGPREYMIAAHSLSDVWTSLETLIAPWINDEDLVVVLKRPSADTLMAVTDAAYGG